LFIRKSLSGHEFLYFSDHLWQNPSILIQEINSMTNRSSSKRAEIRARNRRSEMQKRNLVIALVVLFALVIAFLLIWPNIRPVGDITMPEVKTYANADKNTLGDPNAPVRIDEYSDFQCPACKIFFENYFPRLVTDYIDTGKVYFVSNAFSFIDDRTVAKESDRAAEATYCAADQGKFWEYSQVLYANQTGENIGNFTDRRLQTMAEKLGLAMSNFNSCFNSGKYATQIITDRQAGDALAVNQTPSFVINGQLFDLTSYDNFFQAIDAAAAGK
jgi:protein-disulfide isomerase